MNLFNRFYVWLWSLLPDRCEICKGKRGGIRGNENVIDGVVVCDYCHATGAHIKWQKAERVRL